MALSALPATVVAEATSTSPFEMGNMTNTTTEKYRRVIQSVVVYNDSTTSSQFVIRVGGKTIFKETLQPSQNFAIENFKFTQLNEGSFNNANTKLSLAVVTTGTTLNIVVTYTTITIS